MSEDFTAATTCSFAGIFCWICCPCRLTKNRRFTGLGNGSLPVSFVPPVGAGGWLMLVWPISRVPFSSSAPIVIMKFAFTDGKTLVSGGTRAIRVHIRIAAGNDPKCNRTPVKKQLPTEARRKSNRRWASTPNSPTTPSTSVESPQSTATARLIISVWKVSRKDWITCTYAPSSPVYRLCCPSNNLLHSAWALSTSDGSRCSSRCTILRSSDPTPGRSR
mmetsp:Transcript_4751/g.10479  ORF Transcript_4751/g.10479 Transcript_4751/m.10479 type:complete len:219 (+) Transcript_4751:399-1055(+)